MPTGRSPEPTLELRSTQASSSSSSTAAGGAALDNSSLGSLVLVVDDAPDVVDVASTVYADAGYHVSCAFDGAEAVARALADPPDVVLLDLALPKLDGFGVVRALKADPRTAAIPIVLHTGHVSPEVEAMAHALGVRAFVRKPAGTDALLDVLKFVLT